MSRERRSLAKNLLVAVAVVLAVFVGNSREARADYEGLLGSEEAQDLSAFKGTVTLYMQKNSSGDGTYINDKYYEQDSVTYKGVKPITKLKSSKPKIVAVGANYYNKTSALQLVPLKAGTSKVSFTYKGKKRTVTVVVKKRVNPIKSVKIGSKVYKGTFEKSDSNWWYSYSSEAGYKEHGKLLKWKAAKGKRITVTPASGWKVKSIWVNYYSKSYTYTDKKIKNGSKLPNSFGCSRVSILMQNKSTGGYEVMTYYVE